MTKRATITESDLLERKRIGRTIRLVIKMRGRTIEGVAAEVGINRQGFYDRLRGTIDIAAHELVAVGRALDVEPAVFFRDPDASLGIESERNQRAA